MNKALRIAVSILFSLALTVGLLCVVTYSIAGSSGYMADKFSVHADPGVTEVDPKEYPALAQMITAYLTGRAGSMQTTLAIHGEPREAFNEKELTHMRDVRALLALCLKVALACGLVAVLCLALACVRFSGLRKSLARVYLRVGPAVLILAGILAVWAAIDFDGLFRIFHKLLFTNNLWLLDPRTDLLLQLMPTAFFIGYAGDIAIIWLACLAALSLTAILYLKARKQRS
jgi:integral membrane protein (TIGR01906 family)